MARTYCQLIMLTALAGVLTWITAFEAVGQGVNSVKPWEQFDFRTRTVTPDQLKSLSVVQLKYLRGIVFGKHGRVFQEAAIQDWLKTRSWYRPNPEYALSMLNDNERKNMDSIKEAEFRKHDNIEPGDLKFFRDKPFTAKQLGTHSRIEWLIMRSEIEAIHGKPFPETPWMQSFFEERYWYKANPRYDPSMLSEIERKNLETIARVQKDQRGVALAPGDMEQFQETAITPELLKGLSLFELRLLRNEVYARHGKKFHTPWIQQHFSMEDWYKPRSDFSDPKLSAVESKNVDLIVREETRIHDALATQPIHNSVLTGLFLEDARKLRNEIYARHGKLFKDRWLDSYFRSFGWYKPNPGFNEAQLNTIEKKNVNMLLAYERGAQKEADSTAA